MFRRRTLNFLNLKYGCNPNQGNASVSMRDGSNLPFEVLNGSPSYINLLDALNAWQAVKEIDAALGIAAAASFKHVSPAGMAVATPVDEKLAKAIFIHNDDEIQNSQIALAYAKARGADRMSSFGDFIALNRKCDIACAKFIQRHVSDGIIAPDYDEAALDILKSKKKGSYLVLKMDPAYEGTSLENRDIYGVTFTQDVNSSVIDERCLEDVVTDIKMIPKPSKLDLILGMIALKYTQSNSVAYIKNGQTIGIGAGQQSRIHCTRLAGGKADLWHLRQHQKTLSLPFKADISIPARDNAIDEYVTNTSPSFCNNEEYKELFTTRPEPLSENEKRIFLDNIKGVSLASDAFFPFDDNIQRAALSGVNYISQPGGSMRDEIVIDTCNKLGIAMCFTKMRLFHH